MNWQEKLNEDLEKLFKNVFLGEDIKERLRSDRTMILNLLFNLHKIETILNGDICDITNMQLETKLSYYSTEQLNEYLFLIKYLITRSNVFIEYCDRAIGDVNIKKGEEK